MTDQLKLPVIREMWDFTDPTGTRSKFQSLLDDLDFDRDHPYHLEVITQIARTHGLEQEFQTGHGILDEYHNVIDVSNSRVKTRYHLERGRLYNSDNIKEKALDHFLRAWDLANSNSLHYLAVDAAHMIAIAVEEEEEALEWNLKAIEYAEQSGNNEAMAWLGSLYNNTGWSYFDIDEYNTALEFFQKAYEFHQTRSNPRQLKIAQWTIGRVYRALGRIDEAMDIMRELESEAQSQGREPDGYTLEELAELYLLKEEKALSTKYFGKAYQRLSEDIWLQKNEPERLDRMKRLSE